MVAVGIRELKNNLSDYLRKVDEGEIVLVMNRDQVVAMLGPPPMFQSATRETENDALARLERTGLLRMGHGNPESAKAPPLPKPKVSINLQKLLDDLRTDTNAVR